MIDLRDISDSGRTDGLTGLPSLDSIDEAAGDLLQPGVYLARIQYMFDQKERSRVIVVFDIAAGPEKGLFASLPPSMDWLHTLYLGLKPTSLGRTKRAVKCIGDANPGFDASEAWKRDLKLFNGKLVFLAVSQREWRNSYGEVETSYRFHAMSPDALRSGGYRIPGMEHVDGTSDESVEGEPVDVDALLGEALDTPAGTSGGSDE